MRVHYFQRYHSKENVATSNTMLLLSRVYSYNPNYFYMILNELIFQNSYPIELSFDLQVKGRKSVPDAVIEQPSFKIVVETKLYNNFNREQLINHLDSLEGAQTKILLTLDPKPMEAGLINDIDNIIRERKINAFHVNLTFEKLIEQMENTIPERDFELRNIIEDYKQYCIDDNLIVYSDKWMRAITVGQTFDLNLKYNVYYDNTERGFSDFGYLGLYKEKSVRAIGKLIDVVTVTYKNNQINKIDLKYNKITVDDQLKQTIEKICEDASVLNHDLKNRPHHFFFVEKFVITNFYKHSKFPIQKAKYFDMTKVLQTNDLPNVEDIALRINNVKWEDRGY